MFTSVIIQDTFIHDMFVYMIVKTLILGMLTLMYSIHSYNMFIFVQ